MSESQDLREFIREQSLLSERRAERLHRQVMEEIRRQREADRAYFEKLDRKLDHVIAEGEAQREALFRIFDRLDNGGGATAAG